MSSPFQRALPPLSQPSDLPEMWVLLGCVVLASCLVVSLERTESLGQVTRGCHAPRGAGGSQREAGGATVSSPCVAGKGPSLEPAQLCKRGHSLLASPHDHVGSRLSLFSLGRIW